MVNKVCGVRQNICVFSLYHHPDLDVKIVGYLLPSMAVVQTEEVHASFLLWVI